MRAVVRRLAALGTAGALAATLVACGGGGAPAPPPPHAPPSPTVAPSQPPVHSRPTTPAEAAEAGRVATAEYGGQVLNVEPDSAHGRPTWEVEIAHSRKGRIEVDVAKDTKEILTVEVAD